MNFIIIFIVLNAWALTQLLTHHLKLAARNYGHILFGSIVECLIDFILGFLLHFFFSCFFYIVALIGTHFVDTLSRKRSHYTYVLNNG